MAGSSYRSPRSWMADEMNEARLMNEEVRDQFRHVKAPPYAGSALHATVSFTHTTFTNLNTALALGLTTYGGIIEVNVAGAGAGDRLCLDVAIDGTRVGVGASGLMTNAGSGNVSFNARATGIASGAHTLTLQGLVASTETGQLKSGLIFEAMEIP